MLPAMSVHAKRWLAGVRSAWPLLIVALLLALASAASSAQHPPIKDVYDGIATLDSNGEATIEFPISVTTEHRSFTYQAKPIGAPMPNLFIKTELSNNRFVIAGGAPGGTISWE